MVLNCSVYKGFQIITFKTAVRKAVQECVCEPKIADSIAARTIDASGFTILKAKFARHDFEKIFIEMAKLHERFFKLAYTNHDKKKK